jgi:hypothetical protein
MVLVVCGIIGLPFDCTGGALTVASGGNAPFLIFFLVGLCIFVVVALFLPYEDMSEYDDLDEE